MKYFKSAAASPKLGTIYLGACGVSAASRFACNRKPDGFPYWHQLVLDTDHSQLELRFGVDPDMAGQNEAIPGAACIHEWFESPGRQLRVIPLGETGGGTGGDRRIGEEAIKEKTDEILSWMESLHTLVVVGGIGGGTGGAIPAIVKLAAEAKKPILAMPVYPAYREGGKFSKNAEAVLDELLASCPTCIVYNQKVQNFDRLPSEIWMEIDQLCLWRIIDFHHELICTTGDRNIDLNDYHAMLRAGNYVIPGWAEVTNGDSLFNEESLFTNPYLAQRALAKAQCIRLWFHGPWMESEINWTINAVAGRMRCDLKDENSCIKYGLKEKVTDGRKWVGFMASGPVPDVLEDSMGEPDYGSAVPLWPAEPPPPPTPKKLAADELRETPSRVFVPDPVYTPAFTNGNTKPEESGRKVEIACIDTATNQKILLSVSKFAGGKWEMLMARLDNDGVTEEEVDAAICMIEGETGKKVDFPKKMPIRAKQLTRK